MINLSASWHLVLNLLLSLSPFCGKPKIKKWQKNWQKFSILALKLAPNRRVASKLANYLRNCNAQKFAWQENVYFIFLSCQFSSVSSVIGSKCCTQCLFVSISRKCSNNVEQRTFFVIGFFSTVRENSNPNFVLKSLPAVHCRQAMKVEIG